MRWDCQAELLCGGQINNQFKLGRLSTGRSADLLCDNFGCLFLYNIVFLRFVADLDLMIMMSKSDF